MFDFVSRRREKKAKDILDVENVLQSNLRPISARPEFIHNLYRGLMEYTFLEPESSGLDMKKTAIIALVGAVSLALVFTLWIRLIIVIISTLGMLQVSRQKKIAH